jgi:enoyl-[acyl-carrier protein] reductase II
VDGRGLVASLALGAAGIWVGTRFIASPEARAVPGYKERILVGADDGTMITRAYTGKTCRVLRTGYAREFETSGATAEPFPGQVIKSMQEGANHLGGDEHTEGVDPDREFMPAGQGIGAIEDLVPAGEMVRRFVAEAEAVIDRVAALR